MWILHDGDEAYKRRADRLVAVWLWSIRFKCSEPVSANTARETFTSSYASFETLVKMPKLLVVFGISGQQGSSVADAVLNDPELSKLYTVRGVTRDPTKPAAQSYQKKGVEIVKGDVDDLASVKAALKGAHTVYAMTVVLYRPGGKEDEIQQGKNLADAAVAAGVEYYIWSTVAYCSKISNGKYNVPSFDSKAEVAEYVEGLPFKKAFFAPGGFLQNFHTFWAPTDMGDGTFALTNFVSPKMTYALIDVAADTGKYVGAILAEPDKFNGKTLYASTELRTYPEIAETISKATGKKVRYNQVSEETFRTFLPPDAADSFVNMYGFIHDYGYYGPGTKEGVEWTVKNARGKPTTLEEYLERNPLNL